MDKEDVYNDELTAETWALNSAVECHPHTVEVVGSNPTAPTTELTVATEVRCPAFPVGSKLVTIRHQLGKFLYRRPLMGGKGDGVNPQSGCDMRVPKLRAWASLADPPAIGSVLLVDGCRGYGEYGQIDGQRQLSTPGDSAHNPVSECFYEKVIKVKADVAAVLNLFSDVSIDVRW